MNFLFDNFLTCNIICFNHKLYHNLPETTETLIFRLDKVQKLY